MKDQINQFFKDFKALKMTLEELSPMIGRSVEELTEFFKEYQNYKNLSSFKHLQVIPEYFDENGKKISYRRFHDEDKSFSIKIAIRNNYFLTQSRELDLFIAKKIHGVSPVKGEIDDSDVGGLYLPAWVYYGNDKEEGFPHEIPRITESSVLDLIRNKLPFFKVRIEFDVNYTITISHGENSETLHIDAMEIDTALGLILKGFIEKYNYTFYTIRSYQLEEDLDAEESYAEVNNKPLFLTEEEANEKCQSLKKEELIVHKVLKL